MACTTVALHSSIRASTGAERASGAVGGQSRTTTGAVPMRNNQNVGSKTGFCQSKPESRSFALNQTAEAHGSTRSSVMYSRALQLARTQDFEAAREAFQECVMTCPTHAKAWISWAQMEKRQKTEQANDHFNRCREVLQRGLMANPDSAKLCQLWVQSWGLLELQRGNMLAAVLLLERCVLADPTLSPVLRWKAVQSAQAAVLTRRRSVSPSMSDISFV